MLVVTTVQDEMRVSSMKINERVNVIKQKSAQVYVALISGQTPWYAKVVASLAIVYALSPIDLIPDFIPILGYLDDIIILPILITLCIKLIPKDIWDSYELRSKSIWENGKPTKYIYALPIVSLWILMVASIVIYIL